MLAQRGALKDLSRRVFERARASRKPNGIKEFYERSLMRTGDRGKTRLNTMRKIPASMLAIWRDGVEYADELVTGRAFTGCRGGRARIRALARFHPLHRGPGSRGASTVGHRPASEEARHRVWIGPRLKEGPIKPRAGSDREPEPHTGDWLADGCTYQAVWKGPF